MEEKRLPDISEYYVGDLATAEQASWLHDGHYAEKAEAVLNALGRFAILRSVVEIGCGSGLLAMSLPADVNYLGIDRNETFLGWARSANLPSRSFVAADARDVKPAWLAERGGPFGLVACFSFLKHFGLHEWDERLAALLALAPVAAFEVQLSDRDFDDGVHYHHSSVTQERVLAVVRRCGHRLLRVRGFILAEMPDGTPIRTEWWTTMKGNDR